MAQGTYIWYDIKVHLKERNVNVSMVSLASKWHGTMDIEVTCTKWSFGRVQDSWLYGAVGFGEVVYI